MPYFSIIIPVYNREREIVRAIDSCLSQDFQDYEIVVVDDGSTDGSVAAVQSYRDSRIMLLLHESNRGVCPSRNTAIRQACGNWMVMLDSDHSFVDSALKLLASLTRQAPADVGNVATSMLWDTGQLTPSPDVPDGPIGYEQYLAWCDRWKVGEYFNCVRAEVFSSGIRYPDNRAYEAIFHLELTKRWKLMISRHVVAVYHTDSSNRLCGSAEPCFRKALLLRNARDDARVRERILKDHGLALKEYCPKSFRAMLRGAAMANFLAGARYRGLRHSAQLLLAPGSAKTWATLVLGLIGPGILAWVVSRPWRTSD